MWATRTIHVIDGGPDPPWKILWSIVLFAIFYHYALYSNMSWLFIYAITWFHGVLTVRYNSKFNLFFEWNARLW